MSLRTTFTSQRLSQVLRHFSTSVASRQNQSAASSTHRSMERGKGEHVKEKIVVVGTGWAGWTLSQDLDDKKYDITVISPERTLALTPLLASAACGIFDFRYISTVLTYCLPEIPSFSNRIPLLVEYFPTFPLLSRTSLTNFLQAKRRASPSPETISAKIPSQCRKH